MSAVKLIDCENVSDYDVERIFKELLVYDDVLEEYRLRTVSNSDFTETTTITCVNKDNWDLLRILMEVVSVGDDGLLYLNIT